jgi:hypothetical protein
MTAPLGRPRLVAARPERPRPEGSLELVPALRAPGRRSEIRGVVAPGVPGALVHELRLPGIGGRYLTGIDAHLAFAGWDHEERAALVAALEARAAMWITAGPAAALRRAGLGSVPATARRSATLRYASGRWAAAGAPRPAAVAALVTAGRARGAVCALAASGARTHHTLVSAARDRGARTAVLAGGLSAEIGAAWTIELLVAPALPPGSLVGLRERVAAAARCDWCGVPRLGSTCSRCSQPTG